MDKMILLPSEIRFSQNSISNRFSDALGKEYIGIVLDRICNGDAAFLSKIINNFKIGKWYQPGYDSHWFTVNNRSLWVLKELEVLGQLPGLVQLSGGLVQLPGGRLLVPLHPRGIDLKRLTTQNMGQSVMVRTSPVGGNTAKLANFWRYKQPVMEGYSQVEGLVLRMGDYDDGYDSDEYYH